MNLSLPNFLKQGELKKLRIEAYENPSRSQPSAASFEVMFNPEKYSKKYEIVYSKAAVAGNQGKQQIFQNVAPHDLSLHFVFDGTGSSGEKRDVSKDISDFLDVTVKYIGTIHRPMYLKLLWGTEVFNGVLQNAEVTYTLFKPDGSPLRATIDATFVEDISVEKQLAIDKPSSPDLTHKRKVKDGDSLPGMTRNIYGDHVHFLEVAKANDLDNLRMLNVGENIFFPPLAMTNG